MKIPNLDEVKEQGSKYELLKEGVYQLEVVSSTEGSTQGGDQMLKWKLKEVESGSFVYDNTAIIPSLYWKLKAQLGACGFEVSDVEFDPVCMEGKYIEAEVIVKEYNGKKQNAIKKYIVPEQQKSASIEDVL